MPVRPSDGVTVCATRRLFDVTAYGTRLGSDVSSDGRRFLFVLAQPAPPRRLAPLVVVQGWAAEVARRLAEGR